MDKELNRKEIADVLNILDETLPLLDDAERRFKSARNWGIIDIFGGGFLTNVIKHSKINAAGNDMRRISDLLCRLQTELKDVSVPAGFEVNTMTFATFADFIFDGMLADVYMQTKIASSIDEVRRLRERLGVLRAKMRELYNA